MKIVNFKGGLGNQIFEYLFYLYLKRQNEGERVFGSYWSGSLKLHTDFQLEKIFSITLPPSTLMSNMLSKFIVALQRLHLVSLEEGTKSIFFDGYWLDKKYYENIDVKDILRFRNTDLKGRNLQVKKLIENSNSVSLHIRRGDYLTEENKKNFGDFCTLEYYLEAIDIMQQKVPNCKFFIFSDDIEWARQNIQLSNTLFIEGNKGNDSWIDMYLMTLCKHHIIANSTFSYWGAMLGDNADSVVLYPKKWYIWDNPDIFPAKWNAI